MPRTRSHNIKSMQETRKKSRHPFLDGFGGAGQSDDHALAPLSRYSSGKHGSGGSPLAVSSGGFGHTRNFSFDDFLRRLHRHIPGRKTRTAGGQNQINAFSTKLFQQGSDFPFLIGQ